MKKIPKVFKIVGSVALFIALAGAGCASQPEATTPQPAATLEPTPITEPAPSPEPTLAPEPVTTTEPDRKYYDTCEDGYKYFSYAEGNFQNSGEFTGYQAGFPTLPPGATWCDATKSTLIGAGENRYITNMTANVLEDYYVQAFETAGFETKVKCGLLPGNKMVYYRHSDGSGGLIDIAGPTAKFSAKYKQKQSSLDAAVPTDECTR